MRQMACSLYALAPIRIQVPARLGRALQSAAKAMRATWSLLSAHTHQVYGRAATDSSFEFHSILCLKVGSHADFRSMKFIFIKSHPNTVSHTIPIASNCGLGLFREKILKKFTMGFSVQIRVITIF